MWVYGSGFPKNHNLSTAIEKELGGNFKVVSTKKQNGAKFKLTQENIDNGGFNDPTRQTYEVLSPTHPLAVAWQGIGSALKPAFEPIIVAMKPLEGTYANNAIQHGVAGLNIDECRVGNEQRTGKLIDGGNIFGTRGGTDSSIDCRKPDKGQTITETYSGRWPANFLHDGSDEVVNIFDQQSALINSRKASRFFYCAKASQKEKNRGLTVEKEQRDPSRNENQPSMNGGEGNPYNRGAQKVRNSHPTVKPIALMEYLVKMLTMPSGTLLLDPYCGSGTTLIAAQNLGIDCDGMEMNPQYVTIAEQRIKAVAQQDFEVQVPDGVKMIPKKEPQQYSLFGLL